LLEAAWRAEFFLPPGQNQTLRKIKKLALSPIHAQTTWLELTHINARRPHWSYQRRSGRSVGMKNPVRASELRR
jgi:hypothetical protein